MKFSLLVILLQGLGGSLALEALNFEDQAVCKQKVSIEKSRFVTYWETYLEYSDTDEYGDYGTRYRRNYRLEHYTDYEMIDVCCENYKQDGDYCVPVCDPPCENGICSKPNTCRCRWGYDKSYNTPDHVCNPICYRCEHGKCIAPFVCTCDEGYKYTPTFSDDSDCTPICSRNCTDINAFCESPEVCKCLNNYQATYSLDHEDNHLERCDPVCYPMCVNADCVSPGHCECRPGYQSSEYDIDVCVPRCDEECHYGRCTGPNECTCDYGYSQKNGTTCEPICSKVCENGFCVYPETCSCFDGYGFARNSATLCEPICDRACINGICTSPGTCTCHDGYRASENETMSHICEPHCEPPCGPFGICTAPDTCACSDGYRLRQADQYSNRSLSLEVQNTFDDPVCEPICNGCTDGECVAPNTCVCKTGYEKSRFGTNILCRPVCKPACINGHCLQPNTCKCKSGYRPVKKNLCTPFCKEGCVNGFCNAPNTCSCLAGYELSNSSNMCNPVCKKPCKPNASCTAPETCNCNEGYEDDGKGQCIASCKSCVNGTCVAPNVCKCHKGFSFVEVKGVGACQPVCKTCRDGDCIAPGECRCHAGFMKSEEKNDDGCVSVCEKNCNDRGVCIIPNKTCECHYGWKGMLCDQSMFCRIEMADNETILTTLVNSTDGYRLSKDSPLCPYNCMNDLNKTFVCVETFKFNSKNGSGIFCFIDKESDCYIASTRHVDGVHVTKIAGFVGGSIVIIIILITSVMCLLSYKQHRRRLNLDNRSESLYDQRRTSLLSEDNGDT